LLPQDIEDSFSAKKNAGAVLFDLTAACDRHSMASCHTLWHRAFTCKLLGLQLDRHLVRMIMEIVGNRTFTLTTGNDKRSRLRRLKNSVPQGSVLVPLLLNIYVSDLLIIVSRKYAYADDLAMMHADGAWQVVEQARSQVLRFGGAKYIFRGARFFFLLYF